jgi:hypothetical protein
MTAQAPPLEAPCWSVNVRSPRRKKREACGRQRVRLSPRAVSIRAAGATRCRDYAFSDRVAFS